MDGILILGKIFKSQENPKKSREFSLYNNESIICGTHEKSEMFGGVL